MTAYTLLEDRRIVYPDINYEKTIMTTSVIISDLTDTVLSVLCEDKSTNYLSLTTQDRQSFRTAMETALTQHIDNLKASWIVDDVIMVDDVEERSGHYLLEKTERLSSLEYSGDPLSHPTELYRRISRHYLRTTDRLSLETIRQAEKSGDSDTSVDRHIL